MDREPEFKGTPLGEIVTPAFDEPEVLFYYDQPLLYIARNLQGDPILVNTGDVTTDEDGTRDKLIFARLSHEEEKALLDADRDGLLVLLASILTPEREAWLVLDFFPKAGERSQEWRRATPDEVVSFAPRTGPKPPPEFIESLALAWADAEGAKDRYLRDKELDGRRDRDRSCGSYIGYKVEADDLVRRMKRRGWQPSPDDADDGCVPALAESLASFDDGRWTPEDRARKMPAYEAKARAMAAAPGAGWARIP